MMEEVLTLNSIVYGAAGMAAGYFIGWTLKKAIKILFQISMVVIVLFFSALVYLESIHVIQINERALDNLFNSSYYTIQSAIDKYGISNPAEYIVKTLGLPMGFGLGLGIIIGFFKG